MISLIRISHIVCNSVFSSSCQTQTIWSTPVYFWTWHMWLDFPSFPASNTEGRCSAGRRPSNVVVIWQYLIPISRGFEIPQELVVRGLAAPSIDAPVPGYTVLTWFWQCVHGTLFVHQSIEGWRYALLKHECLILVFRLPWYHCIWLEEFIKTFRDRLITLVQVRN